jgi:hypothetical protein
LLVFVALSQRDQLLLLPLERALSLRYRQQVRTVIVGAMLMLSLVLVLVLGADAGAGRY